MKRQKLFTNRKASRTLFLAAALIAALLAGGCAGSQKAAETAPEPSAEATEAITEAAPAETEAIKETAITESAAAEETPASPEETHETEEKPEAAAASDAAESMADLENNGGYFVRNGDYIYFRIYGPDGLPETALWAGFTQPIVGGTSEIWRLDLNTNQYEKLFDDGGWGGLWFFKDQLWLNRSTDFGDIVYCVDPETYEKSDLTWGHICGVSADGSHLVYESHTDDGAQAFFITGDEEMDRVVFATDDEYLDYCGVVGRDLFFISHTYGEEDPQDELWQLDCDEEKDEAELIRLGTFPRPEYGGSAQLVQFLPDDDKVYVSVEYREGTGHFYAGSHYACAVSGKEDSMELLDDNAQKVLHDILEKLSDEEDEPIAQTYEAMTLKMYIHKPGEPAFAPHLPGDLETSYRDGAFDLILYDSPEILVPSDAVMIFEGWLPEFEYTDENDISCNPQVMEYVDNKAFTMYAESVRAPEEDIGWRSAYRLVRTDYEYFDPADADSSDTGPLRHIDSVEAGRWLDPEKVEELNRQLDWNYCGFFLSSYHDPSEISWFEVFYNGAGIDTELTDKQRKEYLEQTGEEEFYTDVTAIQEKDIRNFVRKTTGTSYDDAKYPISDDWDYMPQYDLYLYQHGDTNAQHITFENGWDLGNNTYRLHYTICSPEHEYNEWPYIATVRIENGQWIFLSNLPE